jgi:hypothetical protein
MCWCYGRVLPDISNDYSWVDLMSKRYKDPVEDSFNQIFGGCAIIFGAIFFLPFVGIGIGIGYCIWG